MSESVNVRFSCGCWKRVKDLHRKTSADGFPDGPWDVTCMFHGQAVVDEVKLMEWHGFCRDCNRGKWFGADEAAARLWAVKHRAYHPEHRNIAVELDKVVKWDGVDPTTGDGSILLSNEDDAKRVEQALMREAKVKAAVIKQAARKREARREKANPVVAWKPTKQPGGTALSFDDL